MVELTGSIRTIVFLVYWPITQREVEKWGFDYLKSEGFDLKVYDLSPFLNCDALKKSPVTSALISDCVSKIASFDVFEDKVREVSSSAVFIDYIFGFSEPDFKTEKIYRILRKNAARYFVISAGALPPPVFAGTPAGLVKILSNKIKNASNPKKLGNYLARKLVSLIKKYFDVYALPDRVFAGDSEVCAQYVAKYRIDRDRVIPLHSLDYDVYLNYLKARDFVPDKLNGTCVFMDEAATHHSDFFLLNIRPISSEKYFASMNRLFDLIEKKTGLRVVIAAHPRSKYEEMPDVFAGREVVKGKTVELVAKSSLVVTHASTAVSFAVIFNKPVLIVKNEEMARHGHYSSSIDSIAHSLGVKSINIDEPEELNTIALDLNDLRHDRYDGYKYKYVKSKGLGDFTVWEVVAREIHRLNTLQGRESSS